jgi:streptomycin 6-kinase
MVDLRKWLVEQRAQSAALRVMVPRSRVRENKRAMKVLQWRQKAIRERKERERDDTI